MTIEKSHNGGYRITDIINGYLFSRLYMGYTKKESIALFKRESRV